MMFGLFRKKKIDVREFQEILINVFENVSESLLKKQKIKRKLWYKCKPEIKFWLFQISIGTFSEILNEADRDSSLEFISDNIILSSIEIDMKNESNRRYVESWWKERSNFYKPDNVSQTWFGEKFYQSLFENPMMTTDELSEIPIEFDISKKFQKASTGSTIFTEVSPAFSESLKKLVKRTEFQITN